jgi:hypothetical protein
MIPRLNGAEHRPVESSRLESLPHLAEPVVAIRPAYFVQVGPTMATTQEDAATTNIA